MRKPQVGKRVIVCCRMCGMILLSQKSKNKGIGPACERKENRLRQIKPYVQEVPFVDNGTTEHLAKVYGDLTQWRESF